MILSLCTLALIATDAGSHNVIHRQFYHDKLLTFQETKTHHENHYCVWNLIQTNGDEVQKSHYPPGNHHASHL